MNKIKITGIFPNAAAIAVKIADTLNPAALGVCASLVATVLNGMCDIDATLHLLGGDLNISWDTESGNVYMEGPATTVFTGTIEI